MSGVRASRSAWARSYLYVPGSRPDRFASAIASGADVVILDLEDSVAPEAHDTARAHVAALIEQRGPAGHGQGVGSPGGTGAIATPLHVRARRVGDEIDPEDLAAVVRPGLDALRLPKCARPEELWALDETLAALERTAGLARGSVAVYPILESAAGVLRAFELARAPRVERLVLGAADLSADLGLPPGDAVGAEDPLRTARAQIVLASAAAGVGAPVDSVCVSLDDENRLRAEACSARALGVFGKSVIHPRQVPTVNEVFAPTDEELRRARAVLAAMGDSLQTGEGATQSAGELVDPAVARRAAGVVALAEALGAARATDQSPTGSPTTDAPAERQGA